MLDAQKRLEAQIADYVQDVIEAGAPAHLVNRRLTLRERLPLRLQGITYGLGGLLASLLPLTHPRAERAVWQEPVPLRS
jgi:hypothetical protein